MTPFRSLLVRFGALTAVFGGVLPLLPAAEPARLLVTNAVILTLAANDNDPFTGYLLVGADGRIAALGRGAPPAGTTAAQTLDAQGMFVMPGFLSGHSHLAASVRRGRLPGKELDGLIDNPVPFFKAEYFGKGDLHVFALHGSLDYLRNGITTAFEYPIRPRYLGEELYKEMFQAELSSGMRLVYGYNVPDLPPAEARQAFLDFKAFAEKEAAGNPRYLKLALAKTGHLGRWGQDFFPTEVAIAKEFKLDLQVHFLESGFYQMQNRADFKMMEEVGALKIGLIYGHFIHYSEEILQKSVAAGARMIWNPLSNGRLGSGLADVPKYLKAGMTVGMGLDGQSTADLADPFENMRMGLYSQRMKYRSASILLPQDMLRLHTLGTANAIGVADQVGSLEAGKFADFLLVDPTQPDTGPVYDPYATLVFVCNNSNVDTVFVGGEAVVKRGQPLKFDAAAVAREAKARVAAMKLRSEKPGAALAGP
jgi:cytosine/adenosine deaminase-related metal-dependent hydrolase